MKLLFLPATVGVALSFCLSTVNAAELVITPDAAQTTAVIGGGEIEGTLNDTFAYNPLTPIAPLPNQSWGAGNGYHAIQDAATMAYTFDDTYQNLFIDLYGRDSWFERDDNLTIRFYDGSWAGVPTQVITPFSISDTPPYYSRVTPDTNTLADRFSISSDAVYLTIMEVRASGSVGSIPEPSTLLMVSAGTLIGLRRRNRKLA
ncbi:MAG TPA: PEP-CTERM sorting domain-containing protein [Tepidisphaeraceae bacterium]|nr:PEP-CTERM sorting domain-containing protein [Tepidisphaeraceae bacterium]